QGALLPAHAEEGVQRVHAGLGGQQPRRHVHAEAALSQLNDKGAGDTNYGNFKNAELDELIDRAEVEMDLEKRQALINKAVEVLQRDVNVIPLHRQVIPWVS